MKKIIVNKLEEIEKKENIKVLHCIESGSRAWGFPSPDSDYDVRFIYVRPIEYYLKLEKTRDVIEWQLDDTLDINGWDLQKALRLLHKSNPTLFEWKNSPIVYKTTDDWKIISDEIDKCFNSKSGLYHYLSTAKSNYREYLKGDTVKVKKYFYVLRPLLACEHIKRNRTAPPMLFSEMLHFLDENVRTEVDKLLELKSKTSELGLQPRIDGLNTYIEEQITIFERFVEEIESDYNSSWGKLNELFLSVLNKKFNVKED